MADPRSTRDGFAAGFPAHRVPAGLSAGLVLAQFTLLAAIVAPWSGWRWSLGGTALVALGAATGLWALSANRPGNFNIRPQPKPGARMVTSGPYRHVRHPMYLAVLLFAAGMCVGYAEAWRWLLMALLAGVLGAKALLEERGLQGVFPAYSRYREQTKRIVPFLW